jgi:hypothetical protein
MKSSCGFLGDINRYIDSLHLEEENQRKESITLIWYKGPPTFDQT